MTMLDTVNSRTVLMNVKLIIYYQLLIMHL